MKVEPEPGECCKCVPAPANGKLSVLSLRSLYCPDGSTRYALYFAK